MVAAATFADIVKQGCNVKEFWVAEAPCDAGRHRKAIGVISPHESSSIGDDFRRVRVNGVGVKEVKLHLPDDATECG